MAQKVLVTGAAGLVGRNTVEELARQGFDVIATDLDSPANRKTAADFRAGVSVRWANLTSAQEISDLLLACTPEAVVHLAAVIPPACYRNPAAAREVNVGGTENLLAAARGLPVPPRFVLASSVAVYGSRNPHRHHDLLRADTPTSASDCYGQHKVEAEAAVRNSGIPWVILRLGAIISANLRSMTVGADQLFLEWSFPSDGRINTVDVRDVASAFAGAVTADVEGQTLLIGGDDTHRLRQSDVGAGLVGALGLAGVYPRGRPGDPNDDDEWFVCDWMDTAPAQRALGFQNHTWPAMIDEARSRIGAWRHLLRLTRPVVRRALRRRSPYRGQPGTYASPWRTVRARWPGAAPDR
ncbi:NAD(P)-dependent oxidoreductase [Mycolicibacterium sp. 3033]|nr:NAD(P)-dependent oxidoreductase [Mycolicibacterium aurantiacum]